MYSCRPVPSVSTIVLVERSWIRSPPPGRVCQRSARQDISKLCPQIVHVLRPRSSRADELLDLLVDLPKSSSTWALIRRALRPPVNWPESSQAAGRPGRRALGPPLAPSELSTRIQDYPPSITSNSRKISISRIYPIHRGFPVIRITIDLELAQLFTTQPPKLKNGVGIPTDMTATAQF
eukprot:COSAG02_NODE_3169_length_7237_cov_11.752592_2_plen_179_part_00